MIDHSRLATKTLLEQREVAIVRELKDKHGIHLFRVSTPIPGLKVNVYFAEKPVPTLIDTPPDEPFILRDFESMLRRTGYSIGDIKTVIITHPHFDHFGSARAITEKSGAQVWAIEGTGAWMGEFEQECFEEEQFHHECLELAGVPSQWINSSILLFRSLKNFAHGVVPSRSLVSNENVLIGSSGLKIKQVPGHTPWCIMLYHEKDKFAFTGDFLLKDISPNPLIQRPWKVPVGYRSLKAYTSSLESVKQMNLCLALPGHGEMLVNPSERIQDLLGLIEDRSRSIMAVLKEQNNQTIFEIVKKLFPKLPGDQIFLAVSEVLAHLEILEDDGLVKRNGKIHARFSAIIYK